MWFQVLCKGAFSHLKNMFTSWTVYDMCYINIETLGILKRLLQRHKIYIYSNIVVPRGKINVKVCKTCIAL